MYPPLFNRIADTMTQDFRRHADAAAKRRLDGYAERRPLALLASLSQLFRKDVGTASPAAQPAASAPKKPVRQAG